MPKKRWNLTLLFERTKWTWFVDFVWEREKERKREYHNVSVCVQVSKCIWVRAWVCFTLVSSECEYRHKSDGLLSLSALGLLKKRTNLSINTGVAQWLARSFHMFKQVPIYIYFTQKLHEAFNFNKNHDVIIIVIVVVISKLNFPSDDCRQYMLATISAGNKLCCNKSPVSCTYLHQDNGGKRMGTVFSTISSLYALLKGEGHTVTVWDSLVARLIGLAVRS